MTRTQSDDTMTGGWKSVKLGELGTIVGGGTPKTSIEEYWNGDIPWLSVDDFKGEGLFVYKSNKHISKTGLENSSTRLLQKEDIIISARGTVGEMAMIPFPMAFNQSCYGIRAHKENVDPYYLFYLLKDNVKRLKHITHGSVFDTITRDSFDNVEVRVPPLDVQRRIAAVLKPIDDKIEMNARINARLERVAQALFKRHFVRFEPYGGTMPPGWRVGTVGEIIELHDSMRKPLSSRERAKLSKIFPYYGATSVMDYVDDYLFDGIYLLLAEDGTVIDKKGFPVLQYVEGKFWVNNHAHIITGKNGFSVETLYLLFSLTNVNAIVTGAVQPKINQANLLRLPAIIPSRDELSKFDEVIQPFFAQIRNLSRQSRTLARLRDVLLPRLMSGAVDVRQVYLNSIQKGGSR